MNIEKLLKEYANMSEITEEEYRSAERTLPPEEFEKSYTCKTVREPLPRTADEVAMGVPCEYADKNVYTKVDQDLSNVQLLLLYDIMKHTKETAENTGKIWGFIIITFILELLAALILLLVRML